MLDHFGYEYLGEQIIKAIEMLMIDNKCLTPDMNGTASTTDVGNAIVDILQARF